MSQRKLLDCNDLEQLMTDYHLNVVLAQLYTSTDCPGRHYSTTSNGLTYTSKYSLVIYNGSDVIHCDMLSNELKNAVARDLLIVLNLKMAKDLSIRDRNYTGKECVKRRNECCSTILRHIYSILPKALDKHGLSQFSNNFNITKDTKQDSTYITIYLKDNTGTEQYPILTCSIIEATFYGRFILDVNYLDGTRKVASVNPNDPFRSPLKAAEDMIEYLAVVLENIANN